MKKKPIILLLLLSGLFADGYSQCSNTAIKQPTTSSNNSAIGTIAWTNLSNVQISDNLFTTAGLLLGLGSTATTNYLVSNSFGFAIPAGATICGIRASIERSVGGLGLGSAITDNSLRIVKGGTITGTEHANTSSNWTSIKTTAVYGGNADLWGATWTAADINSAGFGVAISTNMTLGLSVALTSQVDNVSITVFYSPSLLPVDITSFTAKNEKNAVKLEWQTAGTPGNEYFLVEKSTDAVSWRGIDSLRETGNSNFNSYSSYDYLPDAVNYYRLKKISDGGGFSFSKVIIAKNENTLSTGVNVYPNPVSSSLAINCAEKIKQVRLFDAGTTELLLPQYRQNEKGRIYNVEKLNPGIYFLFIYTDKEVLTKKIILAR